MSTIHPKTGAAAVFASLATLIVAILNNLHGVHVSSEVSVALGGLAASLGAYLAPAPETTSVVVAGPPAPAREPTDPIAPVPPADGEI